MKKLFSLLAAAVLSCVNVIPSYAAYPIHTTASMSTVVWNPTGVSQAAFEIDGRSFVLLDSDSDGNLFVAANEHYGAKSWLMEDVSFLNKNGPAASEWVYDPENTNHIAYWLNHDFLEEGNDGKQIPDIIKKHIITDKEWQVEPTVMNNHGGIKPDTDSQAYEAYRSFAQNASDYDTLRTIRAGVVLLSWTEVNEYKNKIYNADSAWQKAFFTRSTNIIYSYVSPTEDNPDGTFKSECRAFRVIDSDGRQQLDYVIDLWRENTYQVRPAFWLDKEFLRETKMDLSKCGVNVIMEISKIGLADLSDIYSDDELNYMGMRLSRMPSVSDMIITGPRAMGSLNEIFYSYQSPLNYTESGSTFEVWQEENDKYTKASESNIPEFKIDESLAEKNIQLAIVPKDRRGNIGKRYRLSPFKVTAFGTMVTGCSFENGEAEVTLSDSDTICTIILACYDKDNKIKEIVSEDTNTEKTEYKLTLANTNFASGDYTAVMIQYKDGSKPIFKKLFK